jgi:hypothetical protein
MLRTQWQFKRMERSSRLERWELISHSLATIQMELLIAHSVRQAWLKLISAQA